jgi:hypothetical protein
MGQDFRLTDIYTRLLNNEAITSKRNSLTEAYNSIHSLDVLNEAEGTKLPLEARYITRIADAITNEKELHFRNRKARSSGIISKIFVDGQEMPLEKWQLWATDQFAKNKKENVSGTTFQLASQETFNIRDLLKTEALSKAIINVGDAAEGILGAAITAKFKSGGNNVTPQEIIEVLKEAVNNKTYTTTTNYNLPKIKEDIVTFDLSLNKVAIKGLVSFTNEPDPMSSNVPKFELVWSNGYAVSNIISIQNLIKSAAIYTNKSEQVKQAIDKAKQDPKKNRIQVISDGGEASNQTLTKVDLKLMYDGKATRLLSLKAGDVRQFGQVSGAAFDRISEFFTSTIGVEIPKTLQKAYKFKPIDDPEYKDYNYSQGPIANLYKYVEAEMKKKLTGGDFEEYRLIETLYNAITHHATLNEEGVAMVILTTDAKVGYKELSFGKELLEALQNYTFEVVNAPGDSNHKMYVMGKLKSTEIPEITKKAKIIGKPKPSFKNALFRLRTFFSDGAIRNIIEMGDLLKDIADIEKIEKVQLTSPK